MKTKALISLFGSVKAVRNLWTPPLSQSAVYQWPEIVPPLRQYQLREKIPNIDKRLAAAPKKKTRRNCLGEA